MDSSIQEMLDAFKGKALNENIVVREIENKNVTDSGIDMSMTVSKNEKFKKGIVVSIGTLCPPNDVFLGSEILYDSYKASKVTLDTIEYTVVPYSELIHVL
jgi:co-chaperonin GroES (HSP10)